MKNELHFNVCRRHKFFTGQFTHKIQQFNSKYMDDMINDFKWDAYVRDFQIRADIIGEVRSLLRTLVKSCKF